jgi:hypothetical protein
MSQKIARRFHLTDSVYQPTLLPEQFHDKNAKIVRSHDNERTSKVQSPQLNPGIQHAITNVEEIEKSS